MVRVQRVELWFQPWEGYVLPLYDTRILESKVLEPPRRFELRTPALRKRCSSQLSQGGTPWYIIPCELQKPRGFATIRSEFCACSEAGPSRLPVTEEIAGSNPVGRARIRILSPSSPSICRIKGCFRLFMAGGIAKYTECVTMMLFRVHYLL